jgi:hypothetical protein
MVCGFGNWGVPENALVIGNWGVPENALEIGGYQLTKIYVGWFTILLTLFYGLN